MYQLPKLPYGFGALEPYFDARTMEIHYTKHHQAYLDKLNAALEKYPELSKRPAEELLADLNKIPEEIRMTVRNQGGGYVNHAFWWPLLKVNNGSPQGEIGRAIEEQFGGFDKFKDEFTKSALGLFGSGWTWLVSDGKKMEILSLPNQDSPLSQNKIPILGVDVWEHAYYLKYQNRRVEYLEAFFNVVNWETVNELFLKSK
jgi:superoxide dismutase, Fe-Mn family